VVPTTTTSAHSLSPSKKKQFTDLNRNIKIDILAGNKCQVVAPYSQLKVKTENGEKIILDPKTTENYELFIYEPAYIPEVLPKITEEQYQTLIEELEKLLPTKPKEKERSATIIQTQNIEQEEKRHLTEEEIEKLTEILSDYFIEGQRQNLILYLAGYLRKELNVSIDSIYKLYERLQAADDPKDVRARLAAIHKTFEKDLETIAGRTGLSQILGEENANELCDKIKQALGIQPQKTQKSKKKKDDEIFDEEFLQELYEEIEQSNQQTTPREKEFVYVEINRKSRKFARCNYHNIVIEYGAFFKALCD